MTNDLTDELRTNGKDRRAGRKLDEAASKLKDSVGIAQARLGEFADEARTYTDRAVSQLNRLGGVALERAKERPAVSAGVILGVGIGIGALLALALRRAASPTLTESALDGTTRLRRKLGL
jgi:ElaB/YqjD/DUF883 family membrane-anchored ribosome-binding protein